MKFNFDTKTVIIAILIIIILLMGWFLMGKIQKVTSEKEAADKLAAALSDTLRISKAANGQLVYEKLALQADVKTLESSNITLSAEKKELLDAVKALNKKNTVIAATVIKQGVLIDSLTKLHSIGVFMDSTNVTFENSSDSISYLIKVHNVSAVPNTLPRLDFDYLNLPNTQTLAFVWDKDKRAEYPVAVTVTNSNPLYKIYNIEAYAIPELKKEELKPNFWQKVGKFFKKVGDKAIFFAGGFAAGVFVGNQ